MKRMLNVKWAFVALILIVEQLLAGTVSGQEVAQAAAGQDAANPQTTVSQLNQQAMNAYANLQLHQAQQLLQQAMNICTKFNISGEPLARTYLNLGVVEAGGNQNHSGAINYFKQAVCAQTTITLDPLNSTPEIETLFNMASTQAQQPGGCAAAAAPVPVVPTPQPVPQPVYPQPQPAYPQPQPAYPQPQPAYPQPAYPQPMYPQAPMQASLLRHQPVLQQLRLVPIPIYVEINPTVEISQVVLFYRTIGERIFQQVKMSPTAQGYAATIGCDVLQTFDPSGIEYYVAVFDEANQLLGTTGTEAQPHRVTIVNALTIAPPSLPNAAPPARCVEECPPWNPDCNKACKKFGEMCDTSAECCSGMVCVDEACTESEGDSGEVVYADAYDPSIRIFLAFGSGAGVVPGGKLSPPDMLATPPSFITDADTDGYGIQEVDTAFAWSKLHARVGLMFYLSKKFLMGAVARGGLSLDTTGQTPPIAPTILAATTFRIVMSKRGGFELNGTVGLGGGIMYHRIPYTDCKKYEILSNHPWYDQSLPADQKQYGCTYSEMDLVHKVWKGPGLGPPQVTQEKAYFRKAGMFAGELGLESYIWFVRNFGLHVGALADVYAPDFALNFDFQLGLALRF